MCIVIVRPIGAKTPTMQRLVACWESNPDGAGIMYAQDGRLTVVKGLMTFRDFVSAWERVPDGVVAVAHFRIGTSGTKSPKNTHPFVVNENLAFVHNGILLDMPNDSKESDTAFLCRYVLKNMRDGFAADKGVLRLLELLCGARNKLVFLDNLGVVTFVNEGAGVWDQGDECWYSNTRYRTHVPNKD